MGWEQKLGPDILSQGDQIVEETMELIKTLTERQMLCVTARIGMLNKGSELDFVVSALASIGLHYAIDRLKRSS